MSVTFDFFAAANSAEGFFSLFDSLYEKSDMPTVYLINGGPGTGKSTLCRRAAERIDGRNVELLHCSSDPDSLDGIVCDSLNLLMLDATPPHTVKPLLAGVIENTVNTSEYWNVSALRASASVIAAIDGKISARYARAYGDIAVAGDFAALKEKWGAACLDSGAVNRFAERLARKITGGEEGGSGRRKERFLSGITPRGHIFYSDTVHAMCDRIYAVNDTCFVAAQRIIQAVTQAALNAGHDCYCCRCPLHPRRTEHLLIPALKTAVITQNAFHGIEGDGVKRINAERFYHSPDARRSREVLRVYDEAARQKIISACGQLAEIKVLHDELESYYKAAMDFAGVTALCDRVCGEIGLLCDKP